MKHDMIGTWQLKTALVTDPQLGGSNLIASHIKLPVFASAQAIL